MSDRKKFIKHMSPEQKKKAMLRMAKKKKNEDLVNQYMGEMTKDSIGQAFADVWDAISEIVPSVRKQGVEIKITEVVPLRKELDKLEKKIKSRAK